MNSSHCRDRSVSPVPAAWNKSFYAGGFGEKTAGVCVITPGYNLLSELLSLQKTPYVILLAQSADNITYQYGKGIKR